MTGSATQAGERTPGVAAGRLSPARLEENFADIAPRLSPHEAQVAADRCYFCYDAPCIAACPTAIDIPLFIRQIATGMPQASARTIFAQNILGGMCARVCPTETLCEEACVREAAEGKPVEIGRLQRYATDALIAEGAHPFARAKATGKRIAVVGAGPAGLACAHRLAMLGHAVVLHDARPKGGGLNEFGIAAYKTPDGFAQAELDWLLGIGGIEVLYERRLGHDLNLAALAESFDAVFVGIGLGGVNAPDIAGADLPGVRPAVDFIAELRQAPDLGLLPVGRRVVVIGGGMTAVDAAVQSRLLGAEQVSMVYRRDRARMAASKLEQDHATGNGVVILCNAAPARIEATGTGLRVIFERVATGDSGGDAGVEPTGERFFLDADQVLTATGQTLERLPEGLALERGKIRIDGPGRTGAARIWAGGDCALGGDDLTVTAVAQGRDAAMDIHAALSNARRPE